MKLFLIGFMGSGKTFIGKRLAVKLGLDFIDMDEFLTDKQGLSIPEIFERHGEAYFRELEAQGLRELAALESTVVATGGGAPCYFDNMHWMNQNGITVFLDVPVKLLAERLEKETLARPLLKEIPPNDLEAFIQLNLDERISFYQQAQFICHAGFPADEVVENVGNYFERFFQ